MWATKYATGVSLAIAIALLAGLAGCRQQAATSIPPATAAKAPEHVAHHGGCLNAIVTCENGHAEVKVAGDTLQCWFVGGGSNTGESVPIGDTSVALAVSPPGSQLAKILVLKAKPLKLAEETLGHCSYFEGKAPWLAGMTAFVARGTIKQYQGKPMPVRIEYPKGYDPD